MHSSISNSEPAVGSALTAPTNRHLPLATVPLLASVAAGLLGAELLSRYASPRISQIEGRIRSDQRQAMSIGAPAPGSPPTVLVVGNSLLLRGLDYPKIRTEMAPEARVIRFGIETTEYLDWSYGLWNLSADGGSPTR